MSGKMEDHKTALSVYVQIVCVQNNVLYVSDLHFIDQFSHLRGCVYLLESKTCINV
jgi:hypothetical protein